MKKIWIPLLVVIAAAPVHAGERRGPDVAVFVHANNFNSTVVRLAEEQAARMLAGAGISVAWRCGKPNQHGRAEVIEAVLITQSKDEFLPGALAFARLGPDSGTRVEIFYNRIQGSGSEFAVTPILGHVLAHEITHILQGVNRHSETGVMKAHWDKQDWERMRLYSLPFADEDIRLIHAWVERRNQTLTEVRSGL